MMNRKTTFALVLIAGLLVAACGGKEEAPKQVKREAPKAPPPPPVKSIAELVAEMTIDDRIIWADDAAPSSTEDRRAILQFVNAFLRGDAATLRAMMSFNDQLELDAIDGRGQLAEMSKAITMAEIEAGNSPEGRACVLVKYEVGFEYQPQLWLYEVDGGMYSFTSVESPPGIVDRLSGNWIEAWFAGKAKFIEIASQPDGDLEYSSGGGVTMVPGGGGGGGPGPMTTPPSGPGSPPKKGPGPPPGRPITPNP
jgi:hypothetical protein